ncbi:MAG: hypothetical protein ACRDTC_11965 [Pseudonocardiaceae bacterium]
MSKRTRRKKPVRPATRKQVRPTPPQRRADRDEPDLISNIATALADEHPLGMLGLVSALLAALEPRRRGPFDPEPQSESPSRDELVQSFLDVDLPETSALLAVIAAFSGDDMLRRRVHHEISSRAETLPRWLAELTDSVPTDRALEMVHVLRDGDNVVISTRLPGGYEITGVVYIDHNMGTLVKDAFVVPGSTDDLIGQLLAIADDPDTEARDLDAADARARITEAIQLSAMSFPPVESDTWPACRPLIEWMMVMLPEGGTGYQRPEWDDTALAELSQRFFASPPGAGLDDADHRSLLESLLWFGTGYGPGDPLRWSPTAVEIVLADWIPRKIVAEADYLAKAPDLLRAFIRFCHRERGIRAELTTQTLKAVDEYESRYQKLIRSPRPQGPAALLAAMGLDAKDVTEGGPGPARR